LVGGKINVLGAGPQNFCVGGGPLGFSPVGEWGVEQKCFCKKPAWGGLGLVCGFRRGPGQKKVRVRGEQKKNRCFVFRGCSKGDGRPFKKKIVTNRPGRQKKTRFSGFFSRPVNLGFDSLFFLRARLSSGFKKEGGAGKPKKAHRPTNQRSH